MQFQCYNTIKYWDIIKQMKPGMFRIFIIGTTGVGKTKLSIELAKYLNGEVISCDSKQLYKHATIMTAKVTEQQAEGIPHYMINCLELTENTYNRNRYFRQSLKNIKSIEQKDKHAIIVGGTNYYIQTLLYNLNKLSEKAIESQDSEHQDIKKPTKLKPEQQQKLKHIYTLTKEQKYEILEEYDQLIANKVHKNNEQKINLFLQRIIKDEQKISQNYQSITQELRYQNTIVFWLRNQNKEELFSMITKRIYKMTDRVGLSEILSVFYYIEKNKGIGKQTIKGEDFEECSGAASSIGIKQFLSFYLEVKPQLQHLFSQENDKALSYQEIHERISKNVDGFIFKPETLKSCIEQLILDTKHYCKRQVTWIKNRMFLKNQQTKSHFFTLDLSQNQNQEQKSINQRFQAQIKKKAIQILEEIKVNGFGSIVQKQQQFRDEMKVELSQWKKYVCGPCNVEINGIFDWNRHNESKRHIKSVKYVEKKDQRDEYIKQQRQSSRKRKENKQKQAISNIDPKEIKQQN